MYQRLVQYKNELGDCLVPRKYERDPKLSRWVETQRVLWNRDNNNRKQLQQNDPFKDTTTALLMTHTWAVSNKPVWKDAAPEDAATSDVITADNTAISTDPSISIDLAANDLQMNTVPPELLAMEDNRAKRLTPERKKKLDDIGFVWSLRSKRIEDHWDEMFKQLLAYKDHHCDCLVPSRYEENLKLGKWVRFCFVLFCIFADDCYQLVSLIR